MSTKDDKKEQSHFLRLSTLFNDSVPETLEQRLKALEQSVPGRKVFTSSLGIEDQCITHAIFTQNLDIEVITLDTGRLFSQGYDVWAETEARYGKKIIPYYPEREQVEALVAANGINGFRQSVEARKACCHVRKVVPLGRALDGAELWITGIRAGQNAGRANMTFIEDDPGRGLVKANPLLDFSLDDVKAYVNRWDVPVNALHKQGYPSIGCAPCTRAIEPGEDERAGRWWWENEQGSAGGECGLHVGPDGRLVRSKGA